MHRYSIAAFVCWCAIQSPACGALALNSLASYSTTFDTPFLASIGSANPWVNNGAGHVGWYWQNIYSSLTYEAGNPNPITAVSAYSLGSLSDRAMGNLGGPGNGSPGFPPNPHTAWGIVFKNDTTETILSFSVTYKGEQWRGNNTVADSIRFSFKTSTTDVTDLLPASGEAPMGWTSNTDLKFTTPITGSFPLLDGNLPANSAQRSAFLSATILPGEYLALRWYDGDDGGATVDSAMGIDDLTVNFLTTAVPEVSPLLLVGVAAAGAGVAKLAKPMRRNLHGRFFRGKHRHRVREGERN